MALRLDVGVLWLLSLFLLVNQACPARILAVLPVYIKSHAIFTHAIVKELAIRGHDVTIITPFEDDKPPSNYTQILADKKTCWDEEYTEAEKEMFLSSKPPFIIQEIERWSSLLWFTEVGLNSSAVQRFIKTDNSHFDLVITELFFQEAFLMFGHKYKAPVVMLSSFGLGHYINEQMGNPLLLSVAPFEFIDFFGPMNIWQRMKNVIWTLFDVFGRRLYCLPAQQQLAEKHFGNLPKPLPDLAELERNISLILVNTHFSIDTIRPNIPSLVEVGGVHIRPPNELPPNLKKFCDEAKDGFIYFSLGTLVKSSELSPKKLAVFSKVFAGLKQRVLWKWDSDNPPKVSDNVLVSKWLPQSSILNHPNVKLFITHGGLLGNQEAIYYGVPILGMPFFGDQFLIIDKAVKNGYGLSLLYRDITEVSLVETLDRLLNDTSFSKKAKEVSTRFKDKPLTPMDTAIFWIEYVIRNQGSDYMRSPILDLRWYEYLLLDVALILIFGSVAAAIAVYYIITVLFKLLTFRKPGKRKQKSN